MNSDKLIDVALSHFADRGVDGASLGEIASDADVAIETLRAAYSSADELFDQCIAVATRALCDDVSALVEDELTPADRLVRMTRRLATPTSSEASSLLVIVREFFNGHPRAVRAFRASLNDLAGDFLRMIGEAQFRGQLVPLPPRFLVTTLLAGIVLPQLAGFGAVEGRLGGIHERFEGPGGAPRSALLAASIEAFFNGILTGPVELDPLGAVH